MARRYRAILEANDEKLAARKRSIRSMKKHGIAIPKSWSRKPPKHEYWMSFYMQAFEELSTERSIGLSLGPVPISSIWNYCDRYGIVDGYLVFENFIAILDQVYLKWQNDAEKSSKRHGKADNKGGEFSSEESRRSGHKFRRNSYSQSPG